MGTWINGSCFVKRALLLKRRFFPFSFLLFPFLLLLVACGGSDSGREVSFVVFGDLAEKVAYEELVEAFESQHPEINIRLSHIPSQGEYRQRLAGDFAGGDPNDVFLLNYRRFARFAAEGGLEPLQPYLEESGVISADSFYPNTIDSFIWDDQLWCIPQNISSLVVYYNRDLFDAAGVPYPSDDWTRDEFLETARLLTLDTDGDGAIDQYGLGTSASVFRLAPFIWQDGGQLVDDPDNPTTLILDQEPQLSSLQWFIDLQLKEGVVPDAVQESAQNSESRFLNGTLAMYFNSRRGVPTYRTIDRFEWDVAPLPRGEQSAGILHSDAYCMAAKTEDKEAAWTFIEFANSFEGQTVIAGSGRTVPSLIAVAESEAFLDPSKPPANSRVYVDTVPILGTVPIMETWVGVEEAASKEIERAFYGSVSAETAAEKAVSITKIYFDQAQNQP